MRIGFTIHGSRYPDLVWNQCDSSMGRHGDITFTPWDFGADHILCIGLPTDGQRNPKPARLPSLLAKATGRYAYQRARTAFAALGRHKRDVTVFFFEPPDHIDQGYLDAAAEFSSAVFAPDPRAPRPMRMPAAWHVHADLPALGVLQPPGKDADLVCITSGRTSHPGHRDRMDFIGKLRRAGVPLALFGRGLPASLTPRGELWAKQAALFPARFALAIENFSAGDQYVSEKLFDPLLTWTLPLYHGPRAPESILPAGSFIRLPDLAEGGEACVRALLADAGAYERAIEPMREARRRVLGELRLVEWFRRQRIPEILSAR